MVQEHATQEVLSKEVSIRSVLSLSYFLSQRKPGHFTEHTAERKGRNLGKFPPTPLEGGKKKKNNKVGGRENFLVKFQMQLCRTKGENQTCNYLSFRSSEQITLIPQTLYHCHTLFSPQQVYKLFGLDLENPIQTRSAEPKQSLSSLQLLLVIWYFFQERGLCVIAVCFNQSVRRKYCNFPHKTNSVGCVFPAFRSER